PAPPPLPPEDPAEPVVPAIPPVPALPPRPPVPALPVVPATAVPPVPVLPATLVPPVPPAPVPPVPAMGMDPPVPAGAPLPPVPPEPPPRPPLPAVPVGRRSGQSSHFSAPPVHEATTAAAKSATMASVPPLAARTRLPGPALSSGCNIPFFPESESARSRPLSGPLGPHNIRTGPLRGTANACRPEPGTPAGGRPIHSRAEVHRAPQPSVRRSRERQPEVASAL